MNETKMQYDNADHIGNNPEPIQLSKILQLANQDPNQFPAILQQYLANHPKKDCQCPIPCSSHLILARGSLVLLPVPSTNSISIRFSTTGAWHFVFTLRAMPSLEVIGITETSGDVGNDIVVPLEHTVDINYNVTYEVGILAADCPGEILPHVLGEASLPPEGITNGLEHYWRMDEGGIYSAPDSIGGTPLLSGSPSGYVFYRAGKIRMGAGFDGVSDYLFDDQAIMMDTSNGFALSLWVRFNVLSEGGIMLKAVPGALDWMLVFDGSIFFALFSPDGVTQSAVAYADEINANEWYHVVMQVDPASEEAQLWVNGVKSATSFPYQLHWGAQPIYLGWDTLGETFLNGAIDEVGMWKRPLTEAEIGILYNGGDGTNAFLPPEPEPGLIAGWTFDEDPAVELYMDYVNGIGLVPMGSPAASKVAGLLGNAAHFTKPGIGIVRAEATGRYCMSGPRTICGWVKFTGVPADVGLLGKWGGTPEWLMFANETQMGLFVQCDNGPYNMGVDLRYMIPIVGGQWYFFAGAYDPVSLTIKFSVNGAAWHSAPLPAPVAISGAQLVFGSNGGDVWGWHLNGDLDQVGIFDYVLSEAELAYFYNSGNGRSYV